MPSSSSSNEAVKETVGTNIPLLSVNQLFYIKFEYSSHWYTTTMNNSFQIAILRRGLTLTFFVVNLLGLWPFRFVQRNRQIKYSSIKAIYSVCLLFGGLITFQVIGAMTFDVHQKGFFGSDTLRFVLLIYSQSIVISFLFAYLGVHWFAREIENVYIKWVDLASEMGDSICDINFWGVIFKIVVRTVAVEIVQAVGSYTYVANSESTTEILASMPYLMSLLLLPQCVVRLQMNIFYCIVVAIEVFNRIINARLSKIVKNVTESAGYRHIAMCNYCHCSDALDRLSTLQLKLTQATMSVNSIFSIHIVLWTMTIIVTLTVQLLNQVISIVELTYLNENVLIFNVYGILSIILSSFDHLSISNACQQINDSVNKFDFIGKLLSCL